MFVLAPNLTAVPPFGVAGWAVVLVLIGYLTVRALRGNRAYQKLRAARPMDPGALVAYYRRNATRKVGWLLPVGLLLLVVPGLRPAQLGLAWPQGPDAGEKSRFFAFLVVFILVIGVWWKRRARLGRPVPRLARLDVLMPATRAERRWAWAVSISAGICEELIFRGLLITAGIAAGLPPVAAALVSSVLFGVVHLYQGWIGIMQTTLFGLAMTYFLLPTGSLLYPIVLHILIDLRALVMVPAVATPSETVRAGQAAADARSTTARRDKPPCELPQRKEPARSVRRSVPGDAD